MGTVLVRHEAASASQVRRELALDLDLQGVCAASIDDASLVVTELVGNAVRHCADQGDIDVKWCVGGDEILLAVEDFGTGLPVLRDVPPDATSGRGMRIVGALSSAWGVEPTARGKLVWARIPLAS